MNRKRKWLIQKEKEKELIEKEFMIRELQEKQLKEKDKEEEEELKTQCKTKKTLIKIPYPNNIKLLFELDKPSNNTSIKANPPTYPTLIQSKILLYILLIPIFQIILIVHILEISSYNTIPNNISNSHFSSTTIKNNKLTPFSSNLRPSPSKKPIIPIIQIIPIPSAIQETYQIQLNTSISYDNRVIKSIKNEEPKWVKRKYDQIREGNYFSLGENNHYLRQKA